MAEPAVSNQGLNIAGHKIPYALVMAVVGVGTLYVILKSRGGSTVALGAQPTSLVDTSGQAVGSAAEAQFANLGQQLASIQQQLVVPVNPIPAGTQGDFVLNLPLGQSDPGQPTHIAQKGTAVEAFNVSPQLGGEWATTYFQQHADPLAVYQFVTDLYHQEGLGVPPTSGTFRAGTPTGIQTFPFYASGMGPGIVK